MAFFEQIGKKISSASQGAAQQAKNIADVARLNSSIADIEKKTVQLYIDLGKMYYITHKEDPQAAGIEYINELDNLLAEITRLQENKKQIRGIIKCPSCGFEIPSEATFCSHCGVKLPAQEKAENVGITQSERICPNCHMAVPAENLFCNYCGTKLDSEND